jgi:glycosyltransferase involved in cell wall biosynthesis
VARNMDNIPVFSITMATYNRASLLPRAINSVLNQSCQNFELIIIDDGSRDNTEEVCHSFKDSRTLYYKQEQNRGVLACRNRGFDLARGDYTAILDDDDELLPEALEIAIEKVKELSSRGIKIVCFDGMDFERKRRSVFGIGEEGDIKYDDILCDRIHGDLWVVLQRDLLGENDRFDERLWGNEGYLWLKLMRKTKAYYVPRVLYIIHREHGGQRMSNSRDRLKHLPRSTLTNRVFLEEFGDEMKRKCPKVYGRKLGVVGVSQILIDEKNEGRKACLESLEYNISLKCCVLLLLSYILGSSQIKYLVSTYMRLIDI